MSDYQNFPFRLVDVGLDLRDVVDKVSEGKWVRLDNVRPTQEALIATRDGRDLLYNIGSYIHSLKRLDSSTLLIGAGTALYRNTLVYATPSFSGNPLSIVPFRPELSPSPWGYIADSLTMYKVHADGRAYKWGITRPGAPASFIAVGAGNLNSSAPGAVAYDWRYTYYSTVTGAESNPSDTVGGISAVNQSVDVNVTASPDPQVDRIRIYRRGGVITTTWRLSLTVANVTGTYNDNNADSTIALAKALLTTNDVPFTSVDAAGNSVTEVELPYAAGPFLGKFILACGDPYRPGYMYWTNAGNPDGAASTNNIQVTSPSEPLIGVFMYGGTPYLWSRDNLYIVDYGQQGVTFRGRLAPCGRGLASPWAFAVGPMIYFLSQDGIYQTDGANPSESLTEDSIRPIFQGLSVENFSPVDFSQTNKLRLSYAGQELHFLYQDTLGAQRHLYWHTLYQRWKSVSSTEVTNVNVVYGDENQAKLRVYFGTQGGKVYEANPTGTTDNGASITMNARTGAVDMGMPQTLKEYGNIIVDADPKGNTITLTPRINGTTDLTPTTLTGSGRQKFPITLSDTYAYNIAFDFGVTGPTSLYQFDLLWRPDEEEVKHWEFPETSHGLMGWQHVRDAYIALRSNAVVTLTLTIDGAIKTYSLASTGGERRKVYVPLDPRKGKVFRWALDSTASFRVYGDDCEIHVKPWITEFGYELVSPFKKYQGVPVG